MKKAYLVDICICTRVIAEDQEKALQLACEKVRTSVAEYVIPDNGLEIREDKECPYDPLEDDLEGPR